ncbi:MAG TPA: winged helix-turn-helix domain-containing protein [Xanthobacteraceae bacterium]
MNEFVFGQHRLIPDRRALLVDGHEIPIRGRPFDILLALVEHRDRVVTKDELLQRVWAGRIVEEGNLSVHIAGLRKLLGRGFITTAAGRGYRFVAPVEEIVPSSGAPAGTRGQAKEPATNLPASVSPLIGRDAAVAEVVSLLDTHRLVTLVGPGGIGKTRLAFEAGRQLLAHCADGAWLVDLAPLTDGALVPSALASVLGINAADSGAMLDRIAGALRARELLLVLDNCEHLLDSVAAVAEAVAQAGVGLRVLATSREPLKVEGEWLYRVAPLTLPADNVRDPEEILQHSAIELFMSRAAAAQASLSGIGPNADVVAAICRRLDGIPLAIELAAARAATLGIDVLAARLDDRFRLLSAGRRTALPRHQTLRATIDWSYALLSDLEQAVLRRLGIFVGSFGLDAALRVTEDAAATPLVLTDVIASLAAKSLVGVEMDGGTRYRLLETTRAYALEKLGERGETGSAARRHAGFYRDLFAPREPAAQGSAAEGFAAQVEPTVQRIDLYVREIDNVRRALDWAFAPAGDVGTGVALTAAYVPVWLYLSFVGECRECAQRALEALRPDSGVSKHLQIQLHAALGIALVYTTGAVDTTTAVLARSLALAEETNDVEAQLQVLWAMWICRFNNGEIRAARDLAERFLAVARRAGDPVHVAGGERLLGSTLHYHGDQVGARRHLERAAEFDASAIVDRHVIWSHFDHGVMTHARLARVLLLQGSVDQAVIMARDALAAAQRLDHKLSICFALGEAVCPIALMAGDLASAEQSLAMLAELATRHNLSFWTRVASCLDGCLQIRRGNLVNGTASLRAGLAAFERASQRLYGTWFVGYLALGLAECGHADEALASIDGVLAWLDADGARWQVAELLRAKGILSAARGSDAAAKRWFDDAIAQARQQGALLWELRAAVSLAELRVRQGRSEVARRHLAPVYDRFTDENEGADLAAARAILDAP